MVWQLINISHLPFQILGHWGVFESTYIENFVDFCLLWRSVKWQCIVVTHHHNKKQKPMLCDTFLPFRLSRTDSSQSDRRLKSLYRVPLCCSHWLVLGRESPTMRSTLIQLYKLFTYLRDTLLKYSTSTQYYSSAMKHNFIIFVPSLWLASFTYQPLGSLSNWWQWCYKSLHYIHCCMFKSLSSGGWGALYWLRELFYADVQKLSAQSFAKGYI